MPFSKVAGRQVLDSSNTVLGILDNDVDFTFRDYSFHISFENDGGESRTEERSRGNKNADLILKNFDNPLGITYEADFGEHEGKSLRLCLYVVTMGSEKKSRFISIVVSA